VPVEWPITSDELEQALRVGGYPCPVVQPCPRADEEGWLSYDLMIRCLYNAYDEETCRTHGCRFDGAPGDPRCDYPGHPRLEDNLTADYWNRRYACPVCGAAVWAGAAEKKDRA